jgi:hypothetical protein
MAGPIGTVPLALLTNDAQSQLPELIRRMDERVREELGNSPNAETIRTACYLLLGLRYDRGTIDRLFAGVTQLMESSTFNGLLEEGGVRAKRQWLLRSARKRFGQPPADAEAVINSISDPAQLDRMFDAVDQVRGWDELLHT